MALWAPQVWSLWFEYLLSQVAQHLASVDCVLSPHSLCAFASCDPTCLASSVGSAARPLYNNQVRVQFHHRTAAGVKRLQKLGMVHSAPGMGALDMNSAEDMVVAHTREVVPGMVICGMEVRP